VNSIETREKMVERHIARRGISNLRVLQAFRDVPREEFVPEALAEFAYEDAPLPIGEDQTISQPYIVAVMIDALGLGGGERILEVGTGSGYAAAILARIAREVFTIERHPSLAREARERLERLGFDNVVVLEGDGTLGCPEHAPFDAIVVAAGGPEVPNALIAQLAPGGRLVMPVGPADSQTLERVTRDGRELRRESLGDVRFVPLIGEQGWPAIDGATLAPGSRPGAGSLSKLVREAAEPIGRIEDVSLDALLDRIGESRVVLLGEATHGTSEFYRMRARISRELIEKRGFDFVAIEGDWPDAQRVDEHVTGRARSKLELTPFARFPSWMWRNEDVREFVGWLRDHNLEERDPSRRVGFHGLDLYSMFTSIAAVLAYLDDVDPTAARVARARYGTLTPWQRDPAAYGKAVLAGRYASSEGAVVLMLREMLDRRLDYSRKDGARFFDAAQNARLVADAEQYYRAMYYGSDVSWNLRDTHMFDTLQSLLAFHGPSSRGIVWEHNSHVGDATATDMSVRGEHNVGQLARATLGASAYIVGFGTDHGTVAAASEWDGPMEKKRVRPSHRDSFERVFHDSEVPAFLLHLRAPRRAAVRSELISPRLERAIGVIYRPESEMQSHYFSASLASQFDEYVWFDETRAVEPLATSRGRGPATADTDPFRTPVH
jgi:protein-L-isoaspartate(D-aspartate) O-methyltransferase